MRLFLPLQSTGGAIIEFINLVARTYPRRSSESSSEFDSFSRGSAIANASVAYTRQKSVKRIVIDEKNCKCRLARDIPSGDSTRMEEVTTERELQCNLHSSS